ncbi:MAG TPA: glycosyltransferase family 39 protein [Candidatus Limnocylindrales bacterium]|nr:glycosyltransferase family 39 protein [Candidatus Limnocylindrales bacterium]
MSGRIPLPLLAGLLLAGPVAAIVALERFDGLYGQDPFAYYGYATGALRESLLELRRPPPFFWPPGDPLLVALVSLLLGPVPLAGQVVSLLAGGLVAVFTVLLAFELAGDAGGRVGGHAALVPAAAGLMVALNGQLWQSSAVVMADTTGLALATAGVWAVVRYRHRGGGRWLVLAAALLCAATLTRWIYGVVAIPVTAFALAAIARRDRRTGVRHALGAAACVLVFFLPVLAPAIRGAATGAAGVAPFAGNFQVYSWNPLGAFATEFETVDGILRYLLPNGLYYLLAPARWAFLTPLLAPLIPLGAWAARRRLDPALLLLVFGWPLAVYAFHAGAPYQNFRFTLAYLPPLAILAALGLERVAAFAGERRPRLLVGYVAVASLLMSAAAVHTTRTLIVRKNAAVETAEWVREAVPLDAEVLAFGITLTLRHYAGLDPLDLYEAGPAELGRLDPARRPTFLVADTANLATQWAGHTPGLAFRRLQFDPGLDPVGTRGGFTLLRVAAPPAAAATPLTAAP